jgi:hypothetical protein
MAIAAGLGQLPIIFSVSAIFKSPGKTPGFAGGASPVLMGAYQEA